MPETPCLFENQTAVFLKCAEIDCALESAKKPRTAGLCGRTAGAYDCGPLSCAFIERVNKGRKPSKRDMAGRGTRIPKGSVFHRRSRIYRAFSHIAHKRRNVRFKGPRRVHTPPQPPTAHTTAHTAKHGALSLPATAWLCAVSKIATERTAGEPRLPAKGGWTRFGGVADPLGCAARTLSLPQSRVLQPCCVCAYSFITGPCCCSGSSRSCCA